MELIISIITLGIFVGVVLISCFANNKIFEYYDNSELSETASKNAEKILEKYEIIEDENATIQADDKNNITETNEDDVEDDDEYDEYDEDEDEEDEEENDEDEEIKSVGGRVYESDKQNVTTSFHYEAIETDINTNEINNEKEAVQQSAFIKIVKGRNKHFIKTGKDFGVKLSEDIYTSKGVAANCAACYEATKLGDAILKKFIYKLIPLLTAIPAFISQFSWFGILMYILGVLPISNQYMLYFSIIALICCLLTMGNFVYYNYLTKETIKNMKELNIIDDKTDISFMKKTLFFFAFADSSKRFYFLRWFLHLSLGYKV